MTTQNLLTRTLSIAILAGALSATTTAFAAQPKIQFDSKLYDFRECFQGQVIKKSFRITNAGDAPLEISRVDPSCVCTLVSVPKSAIKPGESAILELAFDTTDKIGFNTILVRVYHNDASARDEYSTVPMSLLKIRGEIQSKFTLRPAYVAATGLIRGRTKGKKWTVNVAKNDSRPFKITGLKSAPDYLKATWNQVKEGYALNFELTRNLSLGSIRDHILFSTDDPQQRVISVQISGSVNTIYGYPRIIYFDPQAPSRSIVLPIERLDDRSGLEIKKLEFDRDLIQGGMRIPEPGKFAEIRLTLKDSAPPGPFARELKIHLADPEQPLITVSIIGVVLPAFTVEPAAVALADKRAIKAGELLAELEVSSKKAEKSAKIGALKLKCDLDWLKLELDSSTGRSVVKVIATKDMVLARTKSLYVGKIEIKSATATVTVPLRIDAP